MDAKRILTDITDTWLHHWGWLWMLIGFSGWLVIEIGKNS